MKAMTQERAVRVLSGALVGSDLTPSELAAVGADLERGGTVARRLGVLLQKMAADLLGQVDPIRAPDRTFVPVSIRRTTRSGGPDSESPGHQKVAVGRLPKDISAAKQASSLPTPDPFVVLIDSKRDRS